jgi:hypothetical protein
MPVRGKTIARTIAHPGFEAVGVLTDHEFEREKAKLLGSG